MLLEAMSHLLRISKANAENLVCKYVSKKTEGMKRYVDSLYPKQVIYIHNAGKNYILHMMHETQLQGLQPYATKWKKTEQIVDDRKQNFT